MTTSPGSKVGRPRLTNPEDLLAAAREIGFADLSVGKVTKLVGVKYSTFYRSFPAGIDAFRGELAEQVLGELSWPDGGPWRQHLTALAATLTEAAERWPGLAAAIVPAPPTLQRATRHATVVLQAAGMPPSAIEQGVDTVMALALAGKPVGLVLDGLAARGWAVVA